MWRKERDPESRRALQGLIQITAAFHKLVVMRDARAAHRILLRGIAKLERAPGGASLDARAATLAALAIDEFRESAVRAAGVIAALDDASQFDPALVPRLVYR